MRSSFAGFWKTSVGKIDLDGRFVMSKQLISIRTKLASACAKIEWTFVDSTQLIENTDVLDDSGL